MGMTTPWFSAALPVREGWYEVASSGWDVSMFYFTAGAWHAWVPKFPCDGVVFFGLYQGDKWRGLSGPVMANVR